MKDKNDITGDRLVTKVASEAYRDNYDLIFKKPARSALEELEAYREKLHEEMTGIPSILGNASPTCTPDCQRAKK